VEERIKTKRQQSLLYPSFTVIVMTQIKTVEFFKIRTVELNEEDIAAENRSRLLNFLLYIIQFIGLLRYILAEEVYSILLLIHEVLLNTLLQ